jgi:Sec-independent protein secretion pathway component TatC
MWPLVPPDPSLLPLQGTSGGLPLYVLFGIGFVVTSLVVSVAVVRSTLRRRREEEASQSRRERAFRAVAAAHALAAAGAVFGPPDPLTQLRYLAGGLVVAYPLAYVFVYREGVDRIRERLS